MTSLLALLSDPSTEGFTASQLLVLVPLLFFLHDEIKGNA